MPGRAKMAPLPFVDLAKGKGTALEEREKRGIRWGSSYVKEG